MPDPTVFVVDDDAAVRGGLLALLCASSLSARGFASADEFLAAYCADTPGCLIADMRMPGLSGLELQEKLREDGVNLPIIFITGFGDVSGAVQAMKKGALDFIEKPFDPERLLGLVHEAIASDAAQRASADESARVGERIARLTPREREVLERVAAGQANKVVALELGISERTVELHRGRGLKKLETRSVAELVRLLDSDRSRNG